MEPFVIYRQGSGEKLLLERRRPLTSVTNAVHSKRINDSDVVTFTVTSAAPIEFGIGDYLPQFGHEYKINQIPSVTKNKSNEHVYEVVMEGLMFDLLNAQYRNADVSGYNPTGDFPLTGNCRDFMGVLITNANRADGAGTWVLGECPAGEVKTLLFSNVTCLGALQQIVKAFNEEFQIVLGGDGVRTINIKTAIRILPYEFSYGKEGGLYTMSRLSVRDREVVTRLFAYGSNKNLKSSYRNYSPRLALNDVGYIEDLEAQAFFRIREATQTWDDIYPERIGVVGSMGENERTFVDSTMDFDLMEKDVNGNTIYLLPSVTAKIHFNSGMLAGLQFEVEEYDHATKTFVLKAYADDRGLVIPSATEAGFQLQPGDKYSILEIALPESYIVNAEARLNARARAWLDQHVYPQVNYALKLDKKWVKGKHEPGAFPNMFECGDLLTVSDPKLNILGASKVIGFERKILDPDDYQLTIGDSYESAQIVRVMAEQIEQRKILQINNVNNPATARRAVRTNQELLDLIFDPTGQYFKDGLLRPGSIETLMLSVGAKPQQMMLQNVVIQPNYGGQSGVVAASGGTLIHLSIEPQIRTWNLSPVSFSLGNQNPFYIYARCDKVGTSGQIFFSQIQRVFDAEPTYYYFLVGVLHSVDAGDGVRQISLTYGSTVINGRWIKTGVISSADGQTRFDLDNGEIYGKIKFRMADGNYKDIAELEIPETEIDADELNAQLSGFATSLGLLQGATGANAGSIQTLFDTIDAQGNRINSLESQIDGQIVTHYFEGTPTLVNLPAGEWLTDAVRDEHIDDLYYDRLTYKAYRFAKNGGVYSWVEVLDERVSQALALAAKAQDTADGKRRVFYSSVSFPTPVTPYEKGDLWSDGSNLRIARNTKLTGAYQAGDWELATYYDNTVTAINGGVVTSGLIQLAGSLGQILAGISGIGNEDNSVRFWAGGATENRAIANWRVWQNGVTQTKTRFEIVNQQEVVQGGITGRSSGLNTEIGFWLGTNFENRGSAPTRGDYNGKMYLKDAEIGDWKISGSGLVNDNGSAYIIARRTVGSTRTAATIGANVFPATFGGRGAAIFEATEVDLFTNNYGAVFAAEGGRENFCIYAYKGTAMMAKALANGLETVDITIGDALTTRLFDPSKLGGIVVTPTGSGNRYIKLLKTGTELPISQFKTVKIFNADNTNSNLFLVDTLRGDNNRRILGGEVLTVFFVNGNWYIDGATDNNW